MKVVVDQIVLWHFDSDVLPNVSHHLQLRSKFFGSFGIVPLTVPLLFVLTVPSKVKTMFVEEEPSSSARINTSQNFFRFGFPFTHLLELPLQVLRVGAFLVAEFAMASREGAPQIQVARPRKLAGMVSDSLIRILLPSLFFP